MGPPDREKESCFRAEAKERERDHSDLRRAVIQVDRILREIYGEKTRPLTEDPLDGLIRTILSQNTSDVNSRQAFARLKEKFPVWGQVLDAGADEIEQAIRPGGLSRIKAGRIKEILGIIHRKKGNLSLQFLERCSTTEALDFLLSLPGVGRKTACVELLFYFGRPVFPVDTHILRVSKRLGWIPLRFSADKAHILLDRVIPPSLKLRLHLNLIEHGRKLCLPRKPKCYRCPLVRYCGRSADPLFMDTR